MEHTGNHITLCGTLRALPEYSHSNHERRFFRFELEVERLSGTADVLPVMAAEDVLMAADLFAGGRFLVEGQIRSFNSRAESGRRLIISVFAESVTTTEQPPQNDAVLTGAICKTTHLPADAAGPRDLRRDARRAAAVSADGLHPLHPLGTDGAMRRRPTRRGADRAGGALAEPGLRQSPARRGRRAHGLRIVRDGAGNSGRKFLIFCNAFPNSSSG